MSNQVLQELNMTKQGNTRSRFSIPDNTRLIQYILPIPKPEPELPPPPPGGGALRNMPGWAPGKLSVHEVILARQSKFLVAPTRGGPGIPKPEQIMARTTQNLDTAEYLETNFVTIGKTAAELSQPLPLKGRARTCHLRTVFYYDQNK